MTLRYVLVDVFTDRVFGGNPLAVFPESEGLDGSVMQRIAGELNRSETAFFSRPTDPAHTIRLRIFTPALELPFAGHPTLGAALVLALERGWMEGDADADWVFEEPAGPISVRAERRGGTFSSELVTDKAPERGPQPPSASRLAAMLGLADGDVVSGPAGPATYSCGVPFTVVPLVTREALRQIRLDTAQWDSTLADTWAPHIYAFVPPAPGAATSEIPARMFAPAMGIAEDPATGAAASALAGYLVDAHIPGADGEPAWVIQQGIEMGRPSRIELSIADGTGGVRVRGSSVLVGRGQLTLP